MFPVLKDLAASAWLERNRRAALDAEERLFRAIVLSRAASDVRMWVVTRYNERIYVFDWTMIRQGPDGVRGEA